METMVAERVEAAAEVAGCPARPAALARGERGRVGVGEAANDEAIVAALAGSALFQDYARSFGGLLGLPVALTRVPAWQLPHHGCGMENPFCALLAESRPGCARCLQTQEDLGRRAVTGAVTVTCHAGLCETAVPVRLGEKRIGLLRTGQYLREAPSAARFEAVARQGREWRLAGGPAWWRRLYFGTRVLTAREHAAVVRLLEVFAEQLALLGNRIYLEHHPSENPAIARARSYIQEHHSLPLSLRQVAASLGASPFYFCKLFRRSTGIHFTEYVSRVRVERARNLLLNPNLNVSEIAYEVGFQSLPHFNRMFKKILGQSPTAYRLGAMNSPAAGGRGLTAKKSCVLPTPVKLADGIPA